MKSDPTSALRGAALMFAAFVLVHTCVWAQDAPVTVSSPSDTADAVRNLQDQVRELRTLMEEMRSENAQSRAEVHQLHEELQATRALLQPPPSTPAGQSIPADQVVATSPAQATVESRVGKLEESASLMGSKIDEQYQTKVETASKYRARLHGIILMNAFRNVGGTNNFDVPDYSEPIPSYAPVATMGATLRQSQIGLEIFGPTVGGARTSADVSLDFAGGFAATGNGVNWGLVRLQTANVRFDWKNTSVVAGQDALFISPLSPTSFASLATPTFGLAGNLWAWTPQVRIEHRFNLSDQQTVTVQGGVLDNLDWEYPRNSYYRSAQAGEFSGQPAYAFRTAWSRPVQEHPLSFGVAGYYGRQNWLGERYTDAWAGMADWQIPILPRLSLSGELYRGRDIGGLGGGIGTSIVYGGPASNPFSPIRGVDAAGGWTQLKLQITPKVELNGAISMDDAFTANIRGFASDADNFGPILGRNRGSLGNVIFRPRSDLILAAELRRYRTWQVYGASSTTNQVNLSAGILF